jgi:hypothetical protein
MKPNNFVQRVKVTLFLDQNVTNTYEFNIYDSIIDFVSDQYSLKQILEMAMDEDNMTLNNGEYGEFTNYHEFFNLKKDLDSGLVKDYSLEVHITHETKGNDYLSVKDLQLEITRAAKAYLENQIDNALIDIRSNFGNSLEDLRTTLLSLKEISDEDPDYSPTNIGKKLVNKLAIRIANELNILDYKELLK